LETAHQLMIMNRKGDASYKGGNNPDKNLESTKLLRERLQLELTAAEKELELASRTSDEHTKLLLQLIASYSIKHVDIVSQIISWLEIGEGTERRFQAPDHAVLQQMISFGRFGE